MRKSLDGDFEQSEHAVVAELGWKWTVRVLVVSTVAYLMIVAWLWVR